jgi:hypothetical protein
MRQKLPLWYLDHQGHCLRRIFFGHVLSVDSVLRRVKTERVTKIETVANDQEHSKWQRVAIII